MSWIWQTHYARRAEEIVTFSRLVYSRRLVSAAGGNVSARCGDNLLITASGDSLRDACEDTLLLCDMNGHVLEGPHDRKPSKETPFHAAIYQSRPEVNYIIHGHPVYSTIASSFYEKLPLPTESARLKLVEVPVIPEAPPGSAQLAAHVKKAVSQTYPGAIAYLLAEHGIIALGETMPACFHTAELLEDTAKIALLKQLLVSSSLKNW